MGKAYNARAADGYYDQFLEILYYVYIYIFPRLAKKKKKKKKKKVLFSQNHNYKIIINYKLSYSASRSVLKSFTVLDVCLHSLEYTDISLIW